MPDIAISSPEAKRYFVFRKVPLDYRAAAEMIGRSWIGQLGFNTASMREFLPNDRCGSKQPR